MILLIFSTLISCKKDNSEDTGGIVLLGSSAINGKFYGFSFAKGKIVSDDYDFGVVELRNDSGRVMGSFLTHINLENRFYLDKSFDNLDNAKSYFKTASLSRDTLFQHFALPIKANQIWFIKTNEHKFGKILIHQALNEHALPNSAVEIKFEWKRF